MLASLFAQEKYPTTVNPSASIAFDTNVVEYEVGTVFTPSYTLTLNPGSYSFDEDTNVIIDYYNIKDSNNVSNANRIEVGAGLVREITGRFADVEIKDNTDYYLVATIDCINNGYVPKTNLGNDYEAGQITGDALSIANI